MQQFQSKTKKEDVRLKKLNFLVIRKELNGQIQCMYMDP